MSEKKQIRIRMYRHGLGDCFLLTFPGVGGKKVHMVIDSGVLKGTSDASVKMTEVAEDIERETGGRIAVLVVTHEHWDHVSGFTQAREVWERMTIEKIWLAWTEDPENELGIKLREERVVKEEDILKGFAELKRNNSKSLHLDAERTGRITALMGFLGAAADGQAKTGGTAEALAFIKAHAKESVYYKPGDIAKVPGVSAVRAFVLGPPENEAQIKKSDPSKRNSEVYEEANVGRGLRISATDFEGDDDAPFDPGTGRCIASDAEYNRVFKDFFGKDDDSDTRLELDGVGALEKLAIALDGDTNNSSLALAFELGKGGPILLFPADAQVGNWMSWKDKDAERKVSINEILERTILYKVGHHGSHNATLKDEGLEKMTNRGLIAIVPVDKAMAKKKRWKMPFPPLYERLMERTRGRVILADSGEAPPDPEKLTKLTAIERRKFAKMLVSDVLHHDLFFEL